MDTIPEKGIFRNSLQELQNYTKIGMPYIRENKEFYFKNNGMQDQYILYVNLCTSEFSETCLGFD